MFKKKALRLFKIITILFLQMTSSLYNKSKFKINFIINEKFN